MRVLNMQFITGPSWIGDVPHPRGSSDNLTGPSWVGTTAKGDQFKFWDPWLPVHSWLQASPPRIRPNPRCRRNGKLTLRPSHRIREPRLNRSRTVLLHPTTSGQLHRLFRPPTLLSTSSLARRTCLPKLVTGSANQDPNHENPNRPKSEPGNPNRLRDPETA